MLYHIMYEAEDTRQVRCVERCNSDNAEELLDFWVKQYPDAKVWAEEVQPGEHQGNVSEYY